MAAQSVVAELWRNAALPGEARGRGRLALLWLAASLLAAAAQLYGASSLGLMSQRAVEGDLAGVLRALGSTAVAAAGGMVGGALAVWSLGRFQEDAALSFRTLVARALAQASYPWLESQKTGDLLERANSNLQHAVSYLCDQLPQLISLCIRAGSAAVFFAAMEWRLALVYFAVFPLVIWLQNRLSKPLEARMAEVYKAEGRRSALAQDVLTNIPTVRAYGLEGEMDRRYEARFGAYFSFVRRSWLFQTAMTAPMILISLVPSCLLLIMSALFIIRGWFAIGGLVTLVVLSDPLNESLWKLASLLTQLRSAAAGAARVLEIWGAPAEESASGAIIASDRADLVCFERVSFSYDTVPVLDDLSFTIRKGEKVALVGRSGCGKSTVLKLVAGLYRPTAGKLTLFGRDTSSTAPASVRELLAFVPQDAFLFAESIRQNILHGAPDASDGLLERACFAAGLGFVDRLPQGLDTSAGERGAELSGGQRQRVAVARALLRNAPLVLLDEPTSSLDAIAEQEVQEALDHLLEKRSALIVAHRLSSIRGATRILVLDQGRIVEEGTHDALLARNGLYRSLYRSQSGMGKA